MLFGLAVAAVVFLKAQRCRFGVYLLCVVACLLGLLIAGLGCAMAVAAPSVQLACDKIPAVMQNKTAVAQLTGLRDEELDLTMACLQGGNPGTNYSSQFAQATSILANITNASTTFEQAISDSGFSRADVEAAIGQAAGLIVQVQNNELLDLLDPAALQSLSRMASLAMPRDNCAASVGEYSFVPSLQGQISCRDGTQPVPGNCSQFGGEDCERGCVGFTQQFGTASNDNCQAYNCTQPAQVQGQLDAAFGDTCFYSQSLQSLNLAYDAVRQSHLEALKQTLQGQGGSLFDIR